MWNEVSVFGSGGRLVCKLYYERHTQILVEFDLPSNKESEEVGRGRR